MIVFKKPVDEIWKDIKNFSGYQISDKGHVKSKKMWGYFLMKSFIVKGYPTVCFWRQNKNCNRSIHRLLLETFIGECPNGHESNHKDGNKRNYDLTNLEWITHQQNMQHAVDTKLFQPTYSVGEKAGNSKLKGDEVWLIRKLLWFDIPKIKISKMFKISINTVYQINSGQTWLHIKFVPSDKDINYYKENLT